MADRPEVTLPPEAALDWQALIDSGLLWLINATVFHPRGVGMAVHPDGAGWLLISAGADEPFVFPDTKEIHQKFRASQAFISEVKMRAVSEKGA